MSLSKSVNTALHPLASRVAKVGNKASDTMSHKHATATANAAQIGGAGMAGAAIAHEHQVVNKGRSQNKHP